MSNIQRVMVVDDEASVRSVMRSYLEALGHQPVLAANGPEALAALTPDIDLVLLDVNMPGLNGFDVTRLIRSNPAVADVPILIVTGDSGREERMQAVEAGANDFLAKPFDLTEVRVRTASLLRLKQAQEAERRYRNHLEELVAERTVELVSARERAEAASRAKSAFQAMMSTELLAPVRTLWERGELLRSRLESDQSELATAAQDVEATAQRLHALILDVLDFAAMESDRVEINRSRFAVASLIESAVAALEPVAARAGNSIEVSLPDDLGEIDSDWYKLERTLSQLLDNASKFTHHGTVSLAASRPAENLLEIRVSDTGIGMTADQVRRCFEEFWQGGSPAESNAVPGYGLGLTVARHFAQVLGGDLQMESVPGEGTTVVLTVPTEAPA